MASVPLLLVRPQGCTVLSVRDKTRHDRTPATSPLCVCTRLRRNTSRGWDRTNHAASGLPWARARSVQSETRDTGPGWISRGRICWGTGNAGGMGTQRCWGWRRGGGGGERRNGKESRLVSPAPMRGSHLRLQSSDGRSSSASGTRSGSVQLGGTLKKQGAWSAGWGSPRRSCAVEKALFRTPQEDLPDRARSARSGQDGQMWAARVGAAHLLRPQTGCGAKEPRSEGAKERGWCLQVRVRVRPDASDGPHGWQRMALCNIHGGNSRPVARSRLVSATHWPPPRSGRRRVRVHGRAADHKANVGLPWALAVSMDSPFWATLETQWCAGGEVPLNGTHHLPSWERCRQLYFDIDQALVHRLISQPRPGPASHQNEAPSFALFCPPSSLFRAMPEPRWQIGRLQAREA